MRQKDADSDVRQTDLDGERIIHLKHGGEKGG